MLQHLKDLSETWWQRLSRPVWWGLLGLTAGGIVLTFILIHQAARDLDDGLALFARDRLQAVVDYEKRSLGDKVSEYAVWEELFHSSHQEQTDERSQWHHSVFGSNLRDRFGVDRVLVVSGAGAVREQMAGGLSPLTATEGRLVLQVQGLVDTARLRTVGLGRGVSVSGFVGDAEKTYLASAALILSPADSWKQQVADATSIVMLRHIDREWLAEVKGGLGFDTLMVKPVAGIVNPTDVVLTTFAGVPVAVLGSTLEVPVSLFPKELEIGLLAALLALVGLTLALSRSGNRVRLLPNSAAEMSGKVNTAVVEALQDGVIVIDRSGQILRINPSGADIFGYTTADLEGQSLNMLLKQDQRDAHGQFLEKSRLYAPRVISSSRTLEALHRDGSTLEITLKVIPFADRDEMDGFIGLIRDVTTLRHDQDLLERIRRRFRVLTENAPIAIYIHRHFRPMFANQTMLDMFGLATKADFSSLTSTAQLLAPEMRDWVRSIHEKRLQGEDVPREYTLHCVRLDNGQDFWCKNVSFTLDWDGESAVCTMLIDITAEVVARRERETMLSRLRTIIATTGEAYILTDANSVIMEVNPAVESLLGWRESELLGMPLGELVAPASRSFLQTQLDLRRQTPHRTYRLEFLHRNGSVVATDVAASSLYDNDGTLTGSFAFCRDISATLAYERALRVAKEEADRANRAKSDFLSSMSHELRTPLNAILGFAQLLTTGRHAELTTRQKEYVHHISQAGNLLLTLINEVLDLAKIESGGLALSIERVPVADLVDHCVGVARVLAKSRGIRIDYGAGDNHMALLQADVTRARQVLLNLLSNAVKYNVDQGQVTLTLDCMANGQMRFTIQDTGLGIPAEKHMLIFEPFNRLGQEMTQIEGTGIGLTITKALVERMGGSIGFTSTEGQGSTFWFELPLSSDIPCIDPTLPAPSAPRLPPEILLADHVTLPPCRILYVEDNSGNRALLTEVFHALPQIRFEMAPTAEIGLSHIRELPPDLILMDLNLPGIDGFSALRSLRDDPVHRDIPVICLSANALDATVEKARVAGFAAYLTKPVDIPALLETIAEVLKDSNAPFRVVGAGTTPAQTHRP